MTNVEPPSLWGRMRVGTKILIIPIFFIVAIGIIIFYTVDTLSNRAYDSVLIELVGRQRALQQQHFSQSILVSQGRGRRERLEYTRKVWLESQKALIDGGSVIERLDEPQTISIPAAPRGSIRDHLLEQERLLEAAVVRSEKLQVTPETSPEYNVILEEMLTDEREIRRLGIEIAKGYTDYSREKAQHLIYAQLAIGTLVGLFGLGFGLAITRGITRPLQQVVHSAENIAQGNLRIGKLGINHRDEIGKLATSFDGMLENLKELSGQIRGVTGNINSASAEILASTQQQASSTKEQAATVQEITTTMQEISQSGAEITDKAKQVAASAEATSSVSNSGITAVQNTSRLMEGIRQQVEEVATKIVSLSEKTQAIGEIVSTVNDIAEQSNLLALNASIEAASAGEQGSRFSVVANEMKNLAERAKESTVQVASILGEIQRGINASVMLAEEAVKRSDTGKQQAEVTEKTIHQMMQTTVESINAFQQIIGATSQQQIGFDQVTQGMRDIRQATEQTAIGTSQLEKALANLNDLSLQLRTAVERYQI
ncbi:MAG TPA: methyl-accepting chemotaxis protein [Chthoniobacteraceae bacterium]|nr:methyl-accepting chemotaxis protein [Chthoniobacteraceae bacterium]